MFNIFSSLFKKKKKFILEGGNLEEKVNHCFNIIFKYDLIEHLRIDRENNLAFNIDKYTFIINNNGHVPLIQKQGNTIYYDNDNPIKLNEIYSNYFVSNRSKLIERKKLLLHKLEKESAYKAL